MVAAIIYYSAYRCFWTNVHYRQYYLPHLISVLQMHKLRVLVLADDQMSGRCGYLPSAPPSMAYITPQINKLGTLGQVLLYQSVSH